jgi:predicted transcriptional regulator
MYMVEQLFGSKTRVKLLELFYSNPNRSFYVREITRKIDEQINSVRRELANLLNAGIITSETTNNKLYYEIDQTYEYYKPLSAIFNKTGKKPTANASKVKQTASAADDSLKLLGNVELALYTGQFTRDESSGIDFLIVGNVNSNQVDKYVAELEKQENKQIRYAILSSSDFEYRQKIKDRFIVNVMAAKKQVLIDKNSIFES